MTRSRASARQAGSSFERLIADTLAEHVDDRIDRRVKTGAKDKGDIAGVRLHERCKPTSGKAVIECKDVAKMSLGTWANEAEAERVNDGAVTAAVVHKRRGKGQGLDQWVTMTLRDYVALLTGVRPE